MDKLITILGPTATGKTLVAAGLAARIGGEVISADSRQVYRGMDIGTGKDLADYIVDGKPVPYHLIDIAHPGEEYNLYRFQQDFIHAFSDIRRRGKKAIMCGGTGMYLESIILSYDLAEVRRNKKLREKLEKLSDKELIDKLHSLRDVHNVTDTRDRERLIRAIEISEIKNQKSEISIQYPASIIHHPSSSIQYPASSIQHLVIGINLPRQEVRARITSRLKQRLEAGMIEEVKKLLDSGLKSDQLEFYGLEYKFLTQYVTGKLSYDEMFRLLNTAIHQFAKRQMTWFRRMEKKGIKIHWIDGQLPLERKIESILQIN
ncbi:MAG: tRNA (adenosine(37)-N6)-dimethylallyltransferase MiaA [Bacteroidales bacterium]|jgi:tRNA dimethylallyltransferase|nr:tRNA (adenosine(37)-N6)-dimethylallyltransferase MiaA [Bacteroidales bacterium]